ncbi:MAG: tetratricopeptide repeat protein [Actinomycetota bacterium]
MAGTARDLGIAALKQGDARGALGHLTEALQQNPADVQAQAYLGAAYGQLGMFPQAAECLAKAAVLAPHSAAIQFNYGTALEKCGNRIEAVAAYRQSLALDGNYDRARQALTRLGEEVQAPPAAPTAAAPAAAAPAAPAPTGLSEFALGPAPTDVTLAGGTLAQEPTLQGSAWAASAPPIYGAPAVASEATQEWTPAPGPQPLGDWTPAPPQGGGGLADYQSAPPRPPSSAAQYGPPPVDPTMVTVEAPERSLPRSWKLGHCYLAGMGIGTWWGLVGAIIFMLFATSMIPGSLFGRIMPTLLISTLMIVAVGALVYGAAGFFGGTCEDPETVCSWVGVGIGAVTSLLLIPLALIFPLMGVGGMIGAIIVSRLFGKGLGGKIAEMQTSIFLLSQGGSVSMVRGR